MRLFKILLSMTMLATTLAAKAIDPLDTQIASGRLLVHLLKVSVNHDVMTITLMFENQADNLTRIHNLNPEEIYYVAFGKRYPVLKDAEDKWMLSPYGQDRIFYEIGRFSGIKFSMYKKVVSWMKFEAPPDEAWPIELSLPETTQFLIDKP